VLAANNRADNRDRRGGFHGAQSDDERPGKQEPANGTINRRKTGATAAEAGTLDRSFTLRLWTGAAFSPVAKRPILG
jgi:hypothetical protein